MRFATPRCLQLVILDSSPTFFFIKRKKNNNPLVTSHKFLKMQVFTTVLALVALVTPSLAAPVLEERAATTCGSTSYTATQVNQAAQKACSYYQAGSVCAS